MPAKAKKRLKESIKTIEISECALSICATVNVKAGDRFRIECNKAIRIDSDKILVKFQNVGSVTLDVQQRKTKVNGKRVIFYEAHPVLKNLKGAKLITTLIQ